MIRHQCESDRGSGAEWGVSHNEKNILVLTEKGMDYVRLALTPDQAQHMIEELQAHLREQVRGTWCGKPMGIQSKEVPASKFTFGMIAMVAAMSGIVFGAMGVSMFIAPCPIELHDARTTLVAVGFGDICAAMYCIVRGIKRE